MLAPARAPRALGCTVFLPTATCWWMSCCAPMISKVTVRVRVSLQGKASEDGGGCSGTSTCVSFLAGLSEASLRTFALFPVAVMSALLTAALVFNSV